MSRYGFAPYVSVAQRRARAEREMQKLRKKGKVIEPVQIEGRSIARSFWGKGWCSHLESFSDFSNRLPRGRTYVRNGSVCHLCIGSGSIEAIVSGSELYQVNINIKKLDADKWKSIKRECAGQIGSMLELLQGKLSNQVMAIVTHTRKGLFPLPQEIKLKCNCPDCAVMCKHVAAVLYGVGSRLDVQPEFLFRLRGVDAAELISEGVYMPDIEDSDRTDVLSEDSLGDIFGIDMDQAASTPQDSKRPAASKQGSPKKGSLKNSTATDTNSAQPRKKSSGTGGKASRPFSPTGTNIRKLRHDCGLSVADFAARLKVSPASVYRWEKMRGKCRLHAISLQALKDLRDALD
ncbi:hypothetical protein [Desulfonatronospira sp.]|uniref:hypothetical protein n=1 Tax=Desulfonatronospira sp. TaxID=1962951 RepID=UPI0025BDBB13|nr:hypothetical protein [Desulfonatronospira sp.]